MSGTESSGSSPYATCRSHHSPGGIFKRNVPPFNAEGLSLRFEPFTDTTLALESPDVVGVGGGAWLPPTAPVETNPPLSPPCREIQLPKRLLIAARDKESLLEEIINLKSELNSQSRRFMTQRIQASSIEVENRKLEKDIEELELQGVDARRTGGPERLRSKLHGMKNRLEDLHMICEEQHDELCNLRKDLRLTRTRELEVERDVFAEEIIRLLKLLKRLKAWQNRLSCENKELAVMKDKAILLEIANKRLESCVVAINKTLEKTKQDTAAFKQKALESTVSGKQDERKRKELEDQAAKLAAQLDVETAEKEKWLRKANKLENELRKLSKELREVEAAKAKEALLNAPAPSTPPAKAAPSTPVKTAPPTPVKTATPSKAPAPSPSATQSKPKSPNGKKVNNPNTVVKTVHAATTQKQEVRKVEPSPRAGSNRSDMTARSGSSSKGNSRSKSISWSEETKIAKPRPKKQKVVQKRESRVPKLSFAQIKPGDEQGLAAHRLPTSEAALYAQKGKHGSITMEKALAELMARKSIAAGQVNEDAMKKAAEQKAGEEDERKRKDAAEALRRKQEAEMRKKQEEEAKKQAAAGDEVKRLEEARKKAADDEARRKRLAEEEAQKLLRIKEDEEQKKREDDAKMREEERTRKYAMDGDEHKRAETLRLKEDEDRRKREEEERRKREEEERRRREEEERRRKEEDTRLSEEMRRKEDEERRRKEGSRLSEEEMRRKEEDEKRKKEEENRKRKAEEELKRKEEEDRRKKEEEDRRKKEEEDRRKKEELDRRKKEEEERKKEEEDRKSREEEERKKNEEAQKRKLEEERRKKEADEKRREAERKMKEDEERKKREAGEQAAKLKEEEERKKKAAAEQRPLGSRKSMFEDYTKSQDSDAEARLEKKMRGEPAPAPASGRSASFAARRALKFKGDHFAEDTRQIVDKETFLGKREQRASVGFLDSSMASSSESSSPRTRTRVDPKASTNSSWQ